MTRRRQSPAQTALSIAPVLVALLWIAGIARFRNYELTTNQWAVLLATAFALHLLQKRALRPKPLLPKQKPRQHRQPSFAWLRRKPPSTGIKVPVM